MVNFTVDQMREIMGNPNNIRNMSVIAHVDHGKSTLTDSLVSKAGIISAKQAGEARFTDTRADEQERCITIKSTGISMYFRTAPGEGLPEEDFLINLIDSPGHVDFSSEVTAALRVTDGALVVVDAADGVAVQTRTVLRQSLMERVRPVLHVNKVDRLLLEKQVDASTLYDYFRKHIEDVNKEITVNSESMLVGESMTEDTLRVHPEKGNVSFGSGLQGWAFTLEIFAQVYAKSTGAPVASLMKRMWGENYFHAGEKKWSKLPKEGCVRGFNMYIGDILIKVKDQALIVDSAAAFDTFNKDVLSKINVSLKSEDTELRGKALLKQVLRTWLPAGECLLQMIVRHLPSPKEAQKYRAAHLYEGHEEDEALRAIRECDPNGPLMLYISKMVPGTDKSRFYAFGRVFSGTVATGQKVDILQPGYDPKDPSTFGRYKNTKNIQRTVLMMGRYIEQIADVPCGNTVALVGIDQFLLKNGTLATWPGSYCIKAMKYSVSPVVRVAVAPKDSKELPKLVEGLRRLSKSDPLVVCSTDPKAGEQIIAGCGELHVEICIKDLREEYAQIELVVSKPVVSYKETITAAIEQAGMAKSANKHNKLYITCEPMEEELEKAIDAGNITYDQDVKERAKILHDVHNFDKNQALKIWCFGPDLKGANLFVDATTGQSFLNEIKDHVISGFQEATGAGPVCEEEMTGSIFKLVDITLHADAIHRGAGQISPTTRAAVKGMALCATPVLVEPYYAVNLVMPAEDSKCSWVFGFMQQRRGEISDNVLIEGSNLREIFCSVPIAECFGMTADLRNQGGGEVFPTMNFLDYRRMPGIALAQPEKREGRPMQLPMQAEKVREIRKRKGLPEIIKNDYLEDLPKME